MTNEEIVRLKELAGVPDSVRGNMSTNEEIVEEFKSKFAQDMLDFGGYPLASAITKWLRTILPQKDTEKAHWLRSEIEKLEDGSIVEYVLKQTVENQMTYDTLTPQQKKCFHTNVKRAVEEALTTIITRYKEELKVLIGE